MPNDPETPRLIIPIWEGGYLARDTRANIPEGQEGKCKLRVGQIQLFNKEALSQNEKPVFVVEGEIDAMSIVDAGGEAVALCGVGNWRKLIEAVKKQPPKVPLIIQPDNDKAGYRGMTKLEEELEKLNFFSYRQFSIPKQYKDANEFLMSDREKFIEWVSDMAENADQKREAFDDETVSSHINEFLEAIQKNRKGVAISTGFENLDNMFDGGFYAGLYFVGANSSLGKTTFILQIADNIAKNGYGVLIFSLEMARNELIAKSLSRLSLIKSLNYCHSTQYAKTTRGILKGEYPSSVEREILMQSLNEYATWGENIRITQGVGDVGVAEIKQKVCEYIKYMGTPPVIIIDYLQILAPYNEKYSDKQNTDKNVLELKRLSRDFNVPVVGISSFNRENYKMPVSMASFKESGAIEYSSDVLIGLQFYGWDFKEEESDHVRQFRLSKLAKKMEKLGKSGDCQTIQAKILKNRNGIRGDIFFDFFPKFNFFRPNERIKIKDEEEQD